MLSSEFDVGFETLDNKIVGFRRRMKVLGLLSTVVMLLMAYVESAGKRQLYWFKRHNMTCVHCRRGRNYYQPPKPTLRSTKAQEYTIRLRPNTIPCTIDRRFLSFSVDTIEMSRNFECFTMDSRKVNNLARGLAPAYLRVGGTPEDFTTFVRGGRVKPALNRSCIPKFKSWHDMKSVTVNSYYFDKIAIFAQRNHLQLIFGLNALKRRPDSTWNNTNAEQIMNFYKAKGRRVFYTLGNEPNRYKKYKSASGRPFNVTAQDLARDMRTLRQMFDQKISGPDVAHPTVKSLKFLKDYLLAKPQLDELTYHHYEMHQSRASLDKFLDPIFVEKFSEEVGWVQRIMLLTDTRAELWLGETGSASGGGARNLSDTFAAGFLYLSKLGMASQTCHRVAIRQSFYGGYYGMLDAVTLDPLPDYWSSYLFKRLVGKKLVSHHEFNEKFLKTFAYCDKRSPKNVVIMAINFDKSNEALLRVSGFEKQRVVKYVLTANKLTSKTVLLNGHPIQLTEKDEIPFLTGEISNQPVHMPKTSYGFFVVYNVNLAECNK